MTKTIQLDTIDRTGLSELMAYPRRKMRDNMDVRFCKHAVFYNPVDEECTYCHQDMECKWLNHNDELISLDDKTDDDIRRELTKAMDYVEAQLTAAHLNRRACTCDNCSWLAKVRSLLEISS
ncbi:hypothetical protein [Ferrimonas lipolytica]|uniref:Uncharacterized protein n=1 Tax=Ferrimonas lipolytica TaxID=2724191 RepID=A0A6H1UGQ2_9GAMM|nr:hypothetical protein [Ferrimonas lipolytica]QIZ77809.1 hypothetical protein HER31_13425 [Ferrimonas lipolytica]